MRCPDCGAPLIRRPTGRKRPKKREKSYIVRTGATEGNVHGVVATMEANSSLLRAFQERGLVARATQLVQEYGADPASYPDPSIAASVEVGW